jgi:glycosyltransferase involved in cell wall biosynthesis
MNTDTKPFVSVVVPAYNEDAGLRECLNALLCLDFPREMYEIIVVNNGSTDSTAAIIDSFPVRRVDEDLRGAAHARNAGTRAARGEIIAFTDADCIADEKWLKELLRGIEHEDIGCFAGEFLPRPFKGIVDEYVHNKMLIHQETLLLYDPPVVAAGNAAYRRSVFDAIGFFDTSFDSGEDGDLSWRMQKQAGFRIQYNGAALVSHPHPSRMGEFLRRSYSVGKGVARFRMKHRGDFPELMTKRSSYGKLFLRSLLGSAKYPLLVAGYLRRGMPAKRSFLYPLLDKVSVLCLMAGVFHGLGTGGAPPEEERTEDRRKKRGVSPARLPAASVTGGLFDHIFLDIEKAPLFLHPDPELERAVREDLGAVASHLVRIIPGATVLLTGSFSVGEGKHTVRDGRKVILSDYDIMVVSPSFVHSLPLFVGKRIGASLQGKLLSADLDISLIWKPLIELLNINAGNRIIAGRRDLGTLIGRIPPPRASNAITNAYLFLAGAPQDPADYSVLLSKALIRAAQALLLFHSDTLSQKEWARFSSIRFIQEQIERGIGTIGKEAVAAIQKAGDGLLGKADTVWEKEDYRSIREIIGDIRGVVAPSLCGKNRLRHALWLFHEGSARLPRFHSAACCVDALQTLAEAWGEGGAIREDRLEEAVRLTRNLGINAAVEGGKDPSAAYARAYRLLARYATFRPHKVRFPSSAAAGDG